MAKATPFQLDDQDGVIFDLYQELKSGPLVIAFYPGDFTPVCTKQLCSYRDQFDPLKSFGIKMVGISADSVDKHAEFAQSSRFPFRLLSDPDKKVAKAFGCTSKWILGAVSRGVFVIDTQGEIIYQKVEATPVTHMNASELSDVLTELQKNGVLR